jgi:hypothetical protein
MFIYAAKIVEGIGSWVDEVQQVLILDDDRTSLSFIPEEELKARKEEARLLVLWGIN